MDLNKLLNPSTICVVGASEKDGFGGDVCRNILQYMDPDKAYFVNPKRDSALGKKCFKSITDLPGDIDLVIICTPKPTVIPLLREAAKKGAKGAVVFASGYGEVGNQEGRDSEDELRAVCEELQIALMGPNCAGFVNYVSDVQAFAFLSAVRDRRGSVGVISQSGQLCLSLMDSPNMKFSYSISAGNCAVVKMEQYLEYLVEDENTKVVAMYLEGVKDARSFISSLRKAAIARKPIVVLKAGRSAKGEAIASSHTGSLAGADRVFDAVFKKFGVIRVNDLCELLATSLMLSTMPKLPELHTFASMNLSGGETSICADMGELIGLDFPDFQPETLQKLREILPSYATPNNPLDMTASLSYDAEAYAGALRTVMQDPSVGSVVIGYTLLEEIADPAIHYMAKGMEIVSKEGGCKPMVMMPFCENTRNAEYSEMLSQIGVAILPPTAYAFRALKYLADFVKYDYRDADLSMALPDCSPLSPSALTEHQSKQLIAAYGIPTPQGGIAQSASDAVTIARDIGYPVAMKIDSVDIAHKSDIGGVVLGVADDEFAAKSFDLIMLNAKTHAPGANIGGVLVQPMARIGTEFIIGVKNDAQFGPCVLCGMGGVFVEVFKDTALVPAPLSKKEALAMIDSLKSSALLKGYRGKPPLDIGALADAIVSVGNLAADKRNSLQELDINPLFVYPEGVCAVDALAVMAETPSP